MTVNNRAVLCVLDGWGEGPASPGNAILQAKTPVWDTLRQRYAWTCLKASEGAVGLPVGQMGNSEVGHLTLGAGRVIFQELSKWNQSFSSGDVFLNPHLREMVQALKQKNRSCHVIGLLSDGGVHSHIRHIYQMAIYLAQNGVPVWLHGFLDGRDTSPKSSLSFIQEGNAIMDSFPLIHWATLGGRYYGMDRDRRWDRTEKAYVMMKDPVVSVKNPLEIIKEFWNLGITDEFIPPFASQDYLGIQPEDGLFMMNFRTDRCRQMIEACISPDFQAFSREPVTWGPCLSLTSVPSCSPHWIQPLDPSPRVEKTLGEVVSTMGLRQLRLAETEKYPHVTFFFNGGQEEPFCGEDRVMVPSPRVSTYDLCPEMSAVAITERLIQAINTEDYDFILINYANADMVGHTGNLRATISAIEVLDACLGKATTAALNKGVNFIITSDHGNSECMFQAGTTIPHTAHTCADVPFIWVGNNRFAVNRLGDHYGLQDVGPTILSLMGLPIPQEMTGQSLIKFEESGVFNGHE